VHHRFDSAGFGWSNQVLMSAAMNDPKPAKHTAPTPKKRGPKPRPTDIDWNLKQVSKMSTKHVAALQEAQIWFGKT
jgi:hypothetical protein